MIETVLSTLVAIFLMVIFVLYAYKVSLQYELLLMKKRKKKPQNSWACWKSGVDKQVRNEAIMLYPLFFPVEIEENERQEMKDQKAGIKRINILIYWVLIMVLLLGIYVSKAH